MAIQKVPRRMKDPNLDHIKDYTHVYEPSQDTFLVLSALDELLDSAHTVELPPLVIAMEIGSGSGMIISHLSRLLGACGHHCFALASDINPHAIQTTKDTMTQNSIVGDAINTSFTQGLRDFGGIDILVFNPPYVVTPQDELGHFDIRASWAGGEKGREVLDLLLPNIASLLSPTGMFILLLIEDNVPSEVEHILLEQGLYPRILKQQKIVGEYLYVYQFTFNKIH